MVGEKFNRLEVVEYVNRKKVVCKCDCGNMHTTTKSDLKLNKVKSCGCWKREYGAIRGNANKKHGRTGGPEYTVWRAVKMRCLNPKNTVYHRYGGAGIKMCERWVDSFENFLEDMGPRPSMRHTIDRIDNSRGYEPGNCRWATDKQQQHNRRSNILFEYKGEKKTLSELAEDHGIKYRVVWCRIRAGWPLETALTTPLLARPDRLEFAFSLRRKG